MAGNARLLAGLAAGATLCLAGIGPASARPVQNVPLAEHWNGQRWTQVPLPAGAVPVLTAVVEPSATDVWAFGWADAAEHWDGSSWQKVAMPPSAEFNGAVAVSPSDIWAVGDHEQMPYAAHAVVAHWDGQAWKAMSSPPTQGYSRLVALAATSANDVWAVGYAGFDTKKRITDRTLIVHWDGKAWTRLSTPNPTSPGTPRDSINDSLTAVAAVSPTDAWAVGSYYFLSPNGRHHTAHTLVLHWDGDNWTQVRSVNPGGLAKESVFTGVSAVAPNDVWAVGRFGRKGKQYPLVEHWQGDRWQVVPAPGATLAAVDAVSASDIWAAGGINRGDVIHWGGSAWSVVAQTAPNDGLNAVAARSGSDVWTVGLRFKY